MPARLRVSDAASGEEDLSLVRPQLDADRGLRAAREIFHDRIVGSTYSKTCSAIAGMFDRNGRIFAPAGMMWSVEMLSPRRRRTSPSIVSFGGAATGSGAMLGPRTTWTADRSFGGHSKPDVSTGYFVGSFRAGYLPSSRGSVMTP